MGTIDHVPADLNPPAEHESETAASDARAALEASLEADLEPAVDNLPRFGSACRYCGVRAPADATREGGEVYRLALDAPVPAGAVSAEVVEIGFRRKVRVVRMPPAWRVCSACEALGLNHATGRESRLSEATLAALGWDLRHQTPTALYVAKRHRVTPFHEAGGKPGDRGHRQPWAHDAETLTAAAALLADLEAAGGVPAPFGPGCAVCGRTNSPFGWRDRPWRPQGTAAGTPERLSLCDGSRVLPGRHRIGEAADRRRVGCDALVHGASILPSLAERVHAAAEREGVGAPHPREVESQHHDRFQAWTHPEFGQMSGSRAPWWHLADIPLPSPSDPATAMTERLAELERRVARQVGVPA